MKQLIKSATVFKANFGLTADALHDKLADHQFKECQPLEMRSVGFVPVSETDRLTADFKDGFAFRARIDQKAIPAAIINRKVDEAAAEIQRTQGRKPGKKERAELKDNVLIELAPQAFARTAAITCFYQESTGYLIVPTTSQKHIDAILTALITAAGSVKTETIHVSSVKHGLTKRLKEWNDGKSYAFGDFYPRAEAALQQGDRKINIKMGDLENAGSGIREALESSFEVMSIGFTHLGETEFRLTKDFRLKGIEFSHTDAEDEEESSFYAQATLEVDAVAAVVTALVQMIGHGEEEAAPDAQAEHDDKIDALAHAAPDALRARLQALAPAGTTVTISAGGHSVTIDGAQSHAA